MNTKELCGCGCGEPIETKDMLYPLSMLVDCKRVLVNRRCYFDAFWGVGQFGIESPSTSAQQKSAPLQVHEGR